MGSGNAVTSNNYSFLVPVYAHTPRNIFTREAKSAERLWSHSRAFVETTCPTLRRSPHRASHIYTGKERLTGPGEPSGQSRCLGKAGRY